jgi:hypothetical protein
MKKMLVVLLSALVFVTGLLPGANPTEIVRASAVWNHHRLAEHPQISFIDFIYEHFVANTHDDASGAHQALPIHPQHSAPWAFFMPPAFKCEKPFFTVYEDLARHYGEARVQPASQGVGAPLLRPPQV